LFPTPECKEKKIGKNCVKRVLKDPGTAKINSRGVKKKENRKFVGSGKKDETETGRIYR